MWNSEKTRLYEVSIDRPVRHYIMFRYRRFNSTHNDGTKGTTGKEDAINRGMCMNGMNQSSIDENHRHGGWRALTF